MRKIENFLLKFDIKILGHCKNSQNTANNSKNIVVISVKILKNFDLNNIYNHMNEPFRVFLVHPVYRIVDDTFIFVDYFHAAGIT